LNSAAIKAKIHYLEVSILLSIKGRPMHRFQTLALLLIFFFLVPLPKTGQLAAAGREWITVDERGDWSAITHRKDTTPAFDIVDKRGRKGAAAYVITSTEHVQQGAWVRSFPITGGKHYRISAWRQTTNVKSPRRSAVIKATFLDDKERLVDGEQGDLARPLFPKDRENFDGDWQLVGDTYLAPIDATQVRIELHLRWTENSEVSWSDLNVEPAPAIAPRKVRLASVHFRPSGLKSAAENRDSFAPYVAKAATQNADLVCLGECLTLVGNKLTYDQVAEPIPGPSTKFFGKLAKQHDLYLVAGICELDGKSVYNTSILMGPDGELVGKYRKVCLPREEIQGGVTPGYDYPVFETRFGKVGMMICWDVHFPEIARKIANNGAEVIAMPIWGGNPALARARAIENQVYLVSSTYTPPERDWMKSGVWDLEGKLLVEGKKLGDVLVVEVDLNEKKLWRFTGDLRERFNRERP
jgi:predicted amidohydrolase